MTIPTDRRPIGFWLKLVDRLIDEQFAATLGTLTRRHWQVLNVVHQEASDQATIDARLAPFLAPGSTAAGEVADLRARGWIAGDAKYALTDLGVREFQLLLDTVSADRAKTIDGILREDYAATMATLERIARNLGWSSETA